MLTQLTNVYHQIPSGFWVVLWSALVLSGVVEAGKRLMVKDLSELPSSTQVALTTAVAFAASGVQYISGAASTNPNVLGIHTAVLLAAMHLAYTFVVKPFIGLMGDAKAYRQQTPSDSTPASDAGTSAAG